MPLPPQSEGAKDAKVWLSRAICWFNPPRGSAGSIAKFSDGAALPCPASSGGSTLSRALHDAGDVLKVALAVLIVALAVLVPLALLAAVIAIAWRVSRRRLRERALS